jgi:hypothetical protein
MHDPENPYASPSLIEDPSANPPFDKAAQDWRLGVIRKLQLPALGYLMTATLSFALAFWTIVNLAIYPQHVASEGLLIIRHHLQWYWIVYAPILVILCAHSLLSGLCMLRGRNRTFCLISCAASMIPLVSVAFPISLPFTIWNMVLLRREDVRLAFSPNPQYHSPRDRALRRLFWPAAILLVGEIATAVLLLAPFSIDLTWYALGDEEQFARHLKNLSFDYLGPLVTSLSCLVVSYGVIQMLRGKQYIPSLISAFLAMFPITSPLVALGIPFGIWAFVILLRQDTRAAFAEAK